MFSNKTKTYLDRLANLDRRLNSFLFYGSDEEGKVEAAFYFVRKISGKEKDEEFLRQAREGVHPDVVIVEPEIAEDKKGRIREREIVIEQVRRAQERLKYFPYELRQKFCIIRKAQKLNAEASNSLLKILEEPTESTFFILIASDIDSVLPTIASRCTAVRFAKTDLPVYREENRGRLRGIFTGEIYERFDYAEKISKDRREAFEILEDWENVMAGGLRNLVSKENQLDWEKIALLANLVQGNREALNKIQNTNASPRAVLESLLLGMRWK